MADRRIETTTHGDGTHTVRGFVDGVTVFDQTVQTHEKSQTEDSARRAIRPVFAKEGTTSAHA